MGCLFPGRVMLGVGTGEAMNEVAVTGIGVARVQGALRPPARGGAADARALGGRARQLRGRLLHRPSTPPSTTARTRRSRSTSRPAARRSRATPAAPATASSAPAARAWSSTPRSCCRPSPRGSRRPSATRLDRPHDRDQAVLRPRPASARCENTRFWAPLALTAEQKAGLEDPIEMEPRGRRAADRAGREPLDRRLRPRRGRRADQALRRRRASTTSSSTAPATTSAASSTPSRSSSPAIAGAQRSRLNWWARVHGPPGIGSGSGPRPPRLRRRRRAAASSRATSRR